MKQLRVEVANEYEQPGILPLKDYSAPFLVTKLQERNIAQSLDEAELLLREMKRYLAVVHDCKETAWPMHSALVDETWHQFILYTSEYQQFCACYFGHYMPHVPGSRETSSENRALVTKERFEDIYQRQFGERLPYVWYDECCINDNRRVARSSTLLRLSVQQNGEILLLNTSDVALAIINSIAGKALEFILRHQVFYVRELQAYLTAEERHGLVAGLAQLRVLRITP